MSGAEYCNLHCHSEFSLLDGAAKVVDLAQTAAKAGQTHLALTDHGEMTGAIRHKKACESFGLKPLYGCELFMVEDWVNIKENPKQNNLHLTAIAKDQRGFELMMKGLGIAHREGYGKAGRAKRPFLPIDYPLKNGWKDHVVILSGCANSPFWNLEKSDGIELFKEYASHFGSDFYGEVMPLHDWEDQKVHNEIVWELTKGLHLKSVITNDIHYCNSDDHVLHELILAMGQHGMTWNDPKRWKFSTHQNYNRTADSMLESMLAMGHDEAWAKDGLLRTMEVAEKCTFKLSGYPLVLPNPLAPGVDENEYIMSACADGIRRREVDSDVYWDRLNRELDLLMSKGFVRYMLIVAEVINWARSQGVFIGPARGSVGGCLTAYLLGITDVDPVLHRLSFERFVAPDRTDLPDIDLDIEDRKRGMVEAHLIEKYGTWNVAHVATFGTLLGRAAIHDVSRVFEVPMEEAVGMSRLIEKLHESDPRAHKTVEDTVASNPQAAAFAAAHPEVTKYAGQLEGQIRSTGIHAAGLVISNHDLRESTQCYVIERDGQRVINWDKEDIDYMGLIKVDLLGLATNSVISETLRLIEQRRNKKIDLSKLPFDDKATFDAIGRGETATIFQLNTPGPMGYCRELKPENFEDIAAIAAIWKPGPIKAGITGEYVEVRRGKKTLNPNMHPAYRAIVEPTRGQIIYQEQVVQLLTDLAGFSYIDADKVRKIISKRKGYEAWNEYAQQFINGCKANGTLSEEEARQLWEKLNLFALYAFNRSHAIAYGIVCYWTAWLKTHYPAEYICAYLNCGSTEREQKDGENNLDLALAEAKRLGIKILSPDIVKSQGVWTVENDQTLRAGLQEIKGLGEIAMTELARARAAHPNGWPDLRSFFMSLNRPKCNKTVTSAMMKAGALDTVAGADKALWAAHFDALYAAILSPEKYKKLLQELRALPPVEIPSREGALNYDERAIEAMGDVGTRIARRLGAEGVIEEAVVDNVPHLIDKKNGLKWPLSDATRAYLPGWKLCSVTEASVKKIKAAVDRLRAETKECSDCELRKGCKKPVPIDPGLVDLMIVAEAPGKTEDFKGRPLLGAAGQELFEALARGDKGLPRELFYVDNAVHCRPPNNKLPAMSLVDGCKHLKSAIELVKPLAILALGNKALYALKGKESGIMALNGTTEWLPKYNCWVTWCIHPASVLYHDEQRPMLFKGVDEFKRVVLQFLGERNND